MEDTKNYYPLGQKTFLVMLAKRCGVFLILVPPLLVGLYFLNYIPYTYLYIAMNIIFGYTALMIVLLTCLTVIVWIEYIHYGIFINAQDMKVKRGLLATEELGVPYRRVKDVKIERSIIDQLFGVSVIIITVLGFEGSVSVQKESTIMLPCLDKAIANQIQDSILKKAEVEETRTVA